MNELLRKRIERHLENLTDQQGYQVLDYVEFLESKYGTGARSPTAFERVTAGVEDAMRVGRLPAAAIRETMHAMDSASRLFQRLAEAGKSAAEELSRSLKEAERGTTAAEGEAAAPAPDADTASSEPGEPPTPA
jgi:hypothetical protein